MHTPEISLRLVEKIDICQKTFDTTDDVALRHRAFLRLINFSKEAKNYVEKIIKTFLELQFTNNSRKKYLTDSNCCHPIQTDLQHVITSSRQEGGPTTFPGISNYFALNNISETQAQFSTRRNFHI